MARLPDEYIQKVNDATDIVEIIGEHIQLKKTGVQYTGLCPFHGEKTPSFSVNPAKGVFICRGCGENGNAIQFLMKHTGSEFQETVLGLAKRAGLPGPAPTSYSQQRENGQYNRLQEIMERAKAVYQEALKSNAQSMAYLASRGVTPEMMDTFEIGYAPRGGNLLREKMPDVSEKEFIAAGLVYKSSYNKDQMMEWMNHRIIFPILSSSGKTLAFGGRSMVPNAQRKYMNTPETLLFKKGSELYGLHQANKAIRQDNFAIVTEGYMDSVIPSGMGVGNVVSAMGTAFSEENLRKLFRMTDKVVFCFDGDAAGLRAALHSMEISAELVDDRKSVKFAFLPKGLDPDEFVLQHGAQAFREFLDKSQPMSKFMLSEFSKRNDMSCAEGRAAFACQAMGFIERIQSPMLKVFMIQDVKAIIGPDIPLPGVTEGAPAIVPAALPQPRRSALRMFRESGKKANPQVPAPSESPLAPPGPSAPASNLDADRALAASKASQAIEVAQSTGTDAPSNASPAPGPRRLQFRSRPAATMVEAARDSANMPPPSQAIRLMAFILREPMLATDDVGPLNVRYLMGEPEELAAVGALIERAAIGEGQEPPTTAQLVDAMSQTDHANVFQRVLVLPEFLAEDMDVLGETVSIMKRMTEKAIRSERSIKMRTRTP